MFDAIVAALKGTKNIDQVPKITQISLNKFLSKIEPSLKNNLSKLSEWFKTQVFPYHDPNLNRLEQLQAALALIVKTIPDQKYLNPLFLQIPSVIQLIQSVNNLIDIGFILQKHLERKVKKPEITYDSLILDALKVKFEELFLQNTGKSLHLLRVITVQNFIDYKQINPNLPYKQSGQDSSNLEKQIIIIFQYVIRPLLQNKSLSNIHTQLVSMVKWLIILRDDTLDKQQILMQISRKINSYLMFKKNSTNFHFFSIITLILNLLSIKYLKEDPFHFETLAPLLNYFTDPDIPFEELISNWFQVHKKGRQDVGKLIQNIFRNSLNTGSSVFTFYIFKYFSRYLNSIKDYETLYHIFDSFIRKDFLRTRLPNDSFLIFYLDILLQYTIGFINRDRLDGQTELDVLTDNLRLMLFKNKFTFDKSYKDIIMFYQIYENRFHCLTPSSKKFLNNLQSSYKYSLGSEQIYSEVNRRIFKQFSADYNDDDLQILQRSQRYVGLQNLGNTCYMNSFMQALFMTKKFKTLILQARDQGTVSSSHIKFHALIKLFSELDDKSYVRKYDINPLFFKNTTPQPFCSSWDQHDSGEFGRMYFENIVSELKGEQITQKLERLFFHKMKTTLICLQCKQQREKHQKIFDFILSFDENATEYLSVSDILQKNFEGFQLDNSNMLYCDRCNKKTPVLNIPHPETFAPYLITTVSIFKFDGAKFSKIMKPLHLQFTLHTKNIVPKYEGENVVYQLYAFIVHIGTGIERGHYKCFARNLEQNPTIWYEFNDHYITEREITKFEQFRFGEQESPYILFYSSQRKNNRSSVPKK